MCKNINTLIGVIINNILNNDVSTKTEIKGIYARGNICYIITSANAPLRSRHNLSKYIVEICTALVYGHDRINVPCKLYIQGVYIKKYFV